MTINTSRVSEPIVRMAMQVFILGMADMARQVEKVPWNEFVKLYESVLLTHELKPRSGVEDFIKKVGEAASSSKEVTRYGHGCPVHQNVDCGNSSELLEMP